MVAKKRRIGLYVEARDLSAEVAVNDVPQCQTNGFEPIEYRSIINDWLATGKNQLRVHLDAADPFPANSELQRAREMRFAPSCRVIIREVAEGEAPGPPLLEYRWPNPEQFADALAADLPRSFQSFDIPDPGFGPHPWESSEPRQLTPDTELELARAFAEIFRAFTSKDIDELSKLAQLRNREKAKAIGIDPNEFEATVRKRWQILFDQSDTVFEPLRADDPSDLKFIPCWGARVYAIRALDGHQPIRTAPDKSGLVVSYDVYLGNVGRKWVWVR